MSIQEASVESVRAVYPPHPDPPLDDRKRTSLGDLPLEVKSWVRTVIGNGWSIRPVTELVHINHSFVLCRGKTRVFLKVARGADAPARMYREATILGWLRGLPCPEVLAWEAIHPTMAFLLATWLDAMPLRHLDHRGTLAPAYLPQLGEVLFRVHERLNTAGMPPVSCSPPQRAAAGELPHRPEAGEVQWAASLYLGRSRSQQLTGLWKEAIAWLHETKWQLVHSDLQDKNILLSQDGRLFVCDFEAVRINPLLYDLSVDRIFLKRQLAEEERAGLQRLLLEGYGSDPGLDATGAARLRLLRLTDMLVSQARGRMPALPLDEQRSQFDALLKLFSARGWGIAHKESPKRVQESDSERE